MESEIRRYESLGDIAEHIESEGGILTLAMWQVRDAYGAARLGVNVRASISDALTNLGLDHYPRRDLPDSQGSYVRLVKRGSAVGKLIRAAREVDPESDQMLRDAAAGESQALLRRVRELICD